MQQSKNPKGSLHIYTLTWKVGSLLRWADRCLQKREVKLFIGSQCYISQQSFPVTNNLGFSGDPVVKNPPCNTGGTTSIPGLGRSHKYQGNQARARQLLSLSSGAWEPQLLSLRAAATEARVPGACAQQREKPLQWEGRAWQQENSPCSLQLKRNQAQRHCKKKKLSPVDTVVSVLSWRIVRLGQ